MHTSASSYSLVNFPVLHRTEPIQRTRLRYAKARAKARIDWRKNPSPGAAIGESASAKAL